MIKNYINRNLLKAVKVMCLGGVMTLSTNVFASSQDRRHLVLVVIIPLGLHWLRTLDQKE